MKKPSGVQLISAERLRQKTKEGYSAAHDDEHTQGELALAGALYASPVILCKKDEHARTIEFSDPWPFTEFDDARPRDWHNTLKPNSSLNRKERIRLLAKAGALIAAEIDRLQRPKAKRKT